jgi:hypothetical protein
LSAITFAAVQASPVPVSGLPVFDTDDTLTAFEADVIRVREGIQHGPVLPGRRGAAGESPGDAPQVRLDPGQVERVRQHGTAGTNRMWSQFLPSDPALEMPLYQGRCLESVAKPRQRDDY